MGHHLTKTPSDWARCRKYIEAALEPAPGLETIADVAEMLADGKYKLWPGRNAAAISEICTYTRKKVLNVIHGGGDMDELVNEIEPAMCAYAKKQGCDMVMGTGRKGRARVLEAKGYRFGFVTLVKDLT